MSRVELTSLDRVLFPAVGFTKRQLVEYYRRVAPVLVPHLAGRPLTMGRFPDGVEGRGFAQMECRGRPSWMRVRPLRLRTGEVRNYCVVDDADSLLWVANQNTIELHTYFGRGDEADEPAVLIFDLDPGPGRTLLDAARVALLLRDTLDLSCFAKTSGSAGVHVFAPLAPGATYARAKAFARAAAERLASERPGEVTASLRKPEQAGRVVVDWLQNEPRRSTAAPYSVRALPWPSVSTPVSWDELEAAVARGREDDLLFTPAEVLDRVERLGDLFAPVLDTAQQLPARS